MRRKSAVYRADPVALVVSPLTHEPTRPHRVTLDTVDAYVAQKKRHREMRKSGKQ